MVLKTATEESQDLDYLPAKQVKLQSWERSTQGTKEQMQCKRVVPDVLVYAESLYPRTQQECAQFRTESEKLVFFLPIAVVIRHAYTTSGSCTTTDGSRKAKCAGIRVFPSKSAALQGQIIILYAFNTFSTEDGFEHQLGYEAVRSWKASDRRQKSSIPVTGRNF
ncbi:hypothetical protein BDQ17DRAFT_1328277 [Cyathus striatus]|nr:hypothetical protein BDQ17DRAFT_1328277 [Cyathus striatus]